MKGERSAFPQARVVALAECGTHAMFDVVSRRLHDVGDRTSPGQLIGRLEPGMLCVADRGFYSFDAWQQATATGAGPAVAGQGQPATWTRSRCSPTGRGWPRCSTPPRTVTRRTRSRCESSSTPSTTGAPEAGPIPVDHHHRRPRRRLRRRPGPAYTQRWEIETAFDELKTHQRGPRAVLRSKTPGLVLQEIWGHLCCHYAIRTLMFEAADRSRPRPRPGELRRCAADLPPLDRPAGRLSPLRPPTATNGSGATPSASCSPDSSHAVVACQPARRQTQVHPMARQTQPDHRRLAATRPSTRTSGKDLLIEQYCH